MFYVSLTKFRHFQHVTFVFFVILDALFLIWDIIALSLLFTSSVVDVSLKSYTLSPNLMRKTWNHSATILLSVENMSGVEEVGEPPMKEEGKYR